MQTIADGQLAAAAAAILTGADVGSTRVDIVLNNTSGSSTETVTLTFQRAGGTARVLDRCALLPHETRTITGVGIQSGDVLLGVATDAATVDYLISVSAGGPLTARTTDANGAAKGASAATLAGNTITFGGATGGNTITFPDNLANALTIGEGANAYMTFVTTDSSEAVQFPANVLANNATTPSIETASGKTNTGFVGVKGKTSGELKVTCADALAQTLTLSAGAQTVGAATVTIPDAAGGNKTLWMQSSTSGCIATPVAATGAGGGVAGAAALGSARVVLISSDGATKGVKLPTGVKDDIVFVLNTSATAANLFAASGGTINGGGANVGCAVAASKGALCFCTAADTWTVFDLPAHAGAAA
jgi:hypothetical protein